MIRIKVPATSANMGAGFDCMGIALSLYNIIEVGILDSGLEIIDDFPKVSHNENNLIYRAMKEVFDRVGYVPSGIRIKQKSQIPATRGLGSSSACIIGGMVGANILSGRKLSYQEILDMAARMEGHPDNVTPALFGGLCVSAKDGENIKYKSIKLIRKYKFAVMIPDFFVATRKSRCVIPDSFLKEDAVFNISRAALLVAALSSGDSGLLKTAVDDRMHQPYRTEYIENMEEIFEKTYEAGSCGTYLSGSGPTILSIIDDDTKDFKIKMEEYFKNSGQKWRCKVLTVDNVGTIVQHMDDEI